MSRRRVVHLLVFFFFKQKTAYEMRISDWSSDVCSSDLLTAPALAPSLDQVGRPDHAARDAHRPEQLRNLLAIGRRLNFQIDKPRPLAPLGLEDRGVDLLSYRRANRGTDRTSDDPADRKSTRLNSSH